MDILAARVPGGNGKMVSAKIAMKNPNAPFQCANCRGPLYLSSDGVFFHNRKDCRSNKWLHDWAIWCIGKKDIGKELHVAGGQVRIMGAPVIEAPIRSRKIAAPRRVDVGFRCSIVGKSEVVPLVVEVTHTSGKNAEFVQDMAKIRISVVEFDLGAFLHWWKYNGEEDLLMSIGRWVNCGSHHKNWLHHESCFFSLYEDWKTHRRWDQLLAIPPLDEVGTPEKLANGKWGVRINNPPPRSELMQGRPVRIKPRFKDAFMKRIGDVLEYSKQVAVCSQLEYDDVRKGVGELF